MSRTRYVPKEWKGRLGTGLNKYVISSPDETGKQTITSAPTEITQEGDALSATNLNAFEQRIKDEFDVVVDALDDYDDGTTAVEKAKKDEDGNNIKATYATKAELAAEESARESEDSNLKSAIENTTISWEIMERQIPTENNDGIFLCMDSSAPSSSSSAGLKGQFYMDANYLYLCIANNTWRRVALSTF